MIRIELEHLLSELFRRNRNKNHYDKSILPIATGSRSYIS